MATIYNTTDGPLAIDRAGRVLGGRERRDVDDVDGSPLAGHLKAGRILVLDTTEDEASDEQAKPAGKPGRNKSTTNEEA